MQSTVLFVVDVRDVSVTDVVVWVSWLAVVAFVVCVDVVSATVVVNVVVDAAVVGGDATAVMTVCFAVVELASLACCVVVVMVVVAAVVVAAVVVVAVEVRASTVPVSSGVPPTASTRSFSASSPV